MIKEKYDLTKDECIEHEKKYGRFNDIPPNFKAISEKEFAQSKFFVYDFILTEHRQIKYKIKDKEQFQDLHMYYFHDGTGIGIIRDYWDGKIYYFQFANCEHKMVEITMAEAKKLKVYHAGSCYHVYKCEKCGLIESHDSSD